MIETILLIDMLKRFWFSLGKTDGFFLGIVTLLILTASVWSGVLVYLFFFKHPELKNYPISSLGAVGDTFNVATSFSSLITVFFVAYAVTLQRKEFKAMGEQLARQTTAVKKEEGINRAIKLFEEYELINSQIVNSEKERILNFSNERNRYRNLIKFTVKITEMKKTEFKNYINFDTLYINLKASGIENHLSRILKLTESLLIVEKRNSSIDSDNTKKILSYNKAIKNIKGNFEIEFSGEKGSFCLKIPDSLKKNSRKISKYGKK